MGGVFLWGKELKAKLQMFRAESAGSSQDENPLE
jgi:hypothetical protein